MCSSILEQCLWGLYSGTLVMCHYDGLALTDRMLMDDTKIRHSEPFCGETPHAQGSHMSAVLKKTKEQQAMMYSGSLTSVINIQASDISIYAGLIAHYVSTWSL